MVPFDRAVIAPRRRLGTIYLRLHRATPDALPRIVKDLEQVIARLKQLAGMTPGEK